ncbi:MAG: hypothetical protein FJZ43_01820 [Candidatus Staskawiczbacteria bacterium]|nr:hypothetical protein [Candidatus Staskawiczbacteria bacterium]
MSPKSFFKEKAISKVIFSALILAVFAWIFGPSIYLQFTEKIELVSAEGSGYGPPPPPTCYQEGDPAFISAIDDQVISVGDNISFILYSINIKSSIYTISDSFEGTSIVNTNIDSSGHFSWIPLESDIGVHNIEVVASGECDALISINFKISVDLLPQDEYVDDENSIDPENQTKDPSIRISPKLPNTGKMSKPGYIK